MQPLHEIKVTAYLRKLLANYLTNYGSTKYRITAGVPQASALGQLGLLKLTLTTYAAVVIIPKHFKEMNFTLDLILEKISKWMKTVNFEQAKYKTDATFIMSSIRMDCISLRVEDHDIDV